MSTTTTQYKILIGGELADAASGETMEVIAPATGETIAEVSRCGAEDVDRTVEAAQTAAPEWLEKTPKERSELPHGGYKQSGYGKDMSIYSMEEYTQLKHVAVKID
jgi:acyl-CoA reductase-like NAD-dependent aldehyde dehydrogenase